MKKNVFKKIVATVMAAATTLAACFALTSCGDKTFEKNSFKIGGTGPLTGDNASYGISVQNGAKLAVKHLNEKGDVKFSYAMLDDQCDPVAAGANYDTLIDAGMQMSLSGVTSGAAEAFATKANVDKLFSMSPSASADPVINNKDYSFRLCFGDPDQGQLAAQTIKAGIDAGTYATVGVIYDNSDSYSEGLYQAFADEMEALGVQYVEAKFDKDNKTEFGTQVSALKDCDIVFMPFYYTEASLFIKQAVAAGSDAVFFGSDGFDGIAELIPGVTNKVMYITPFDVKSTEQAVVNFVAAYEAEYGVKPDQFAADAYDVVMAMAKALEIAGVTDYNMSAEEMSAVLISTMTSSSFSYDGLTGDGMKWTKDGKCVKAAKIVEL